MMDSPTQTRLASLRDLLSVRLRELRAEFHAAQDARGTAEGFGSHEVLDRKDEAMRQQMEDVGAAEDNRVVEELAEVASALARLDAGTYGSCIDCSEPVPVQRLLVQPAALRCAACQAAQEQAVARSR